MKQEKKKHSGFLTCFILQPLSRNQIRGKLLLSQKLYATSEGAVSHNVLYYQPLPITCIQERFHDDNYFE